jgi:hypothetical protein
MLTKEFILNWLEESLRLDDSSVLQDPAYTILKSQLPSIYTLAILAHDPSYTEDTIPEEEVFFAILKAKTEVYYRLATTSAPFYPITAEGAELRKDYRFEHYMSLIRRVGQEYDSMWEKFQEGKPIDVITVKLAKYHYTLREFNNANIPKVTAKLVNAGTRYLDISWNKFDVIGGLFARYNVYVHTEPIYDEFELELNKSAKLMADITNIHLTKFRIKGLTPDTNYYVLVVSQDRNGLKGFSQIEAKTSADLVATTP